MASSNNFSKIISLIEITFVLLALGLGYTINEIINQYKKDEKSVQTEKVLKELNELKTIYNSKIADQSSVKTNEQVPEEPLASPIKEINKENVDKQAVQNKVVAQTSKTNYDDLDEKSKNILGKVNTSETKKKEPVATSIIQKTTPTASIEVKPHTTPVVTLEKKRDVVIAPEKKKVYSKVIVSHLFPRVYKSSNGNSAMITDLAKNASFVRVSFDVEANETAKPEKKIYYVQIINSKNNVIGKRVTEFFNDESLTYSFSKEINYNNEAIQLFEDIECDHFEKGTYNVFIYDRDEMVGSTKFTLK